MTQNRDKSPTNITKSIVRRISKQISDPEEFATWLFKNLPYKVIIRLVHLYYSELEALGCDGMEMNE